MFDCVLLVYGVTSKTTAPHSVLTVVDPALRTTLLTPDTGPTLVLEEDKTHGADRVGIIDLDPLAGVRLGGRTYLLDDRGISVITQIAPADPDANLDVEDFVQYPDRFFLEGATHDPAQQRIVAIGFDGAGALARVSFDGARLTLSSLPFPPGLTNLGGEQGGGTVRATIQASASGELVVAVRDGEKLFLGSADGTGVDYRSAIPLREPIGAPYLVAEGSDVRCYQAEGPGSAANHVRGFSWREPSAPPLEIDLGGSVRTLGILGASESGRAPFLAVARQEHLDTVRLEAGPADESDDSVEFATVAWNAQEPKFFTPLALHFTLYALLSILGRRRANLEPRIIVYRPAPLLRRLAAAVVDFSVLIFVCWGVFRLSNGPAEMSYFSSHTEAIGSEAGLNAFLTRLNRDAIFASICADYLFLVMFLLTMIHACCDALFGRTLGKRLLGLRVMSVDGDPPSVGAVATRALLMLVDYIVYAGLVGLSFILFSKRRQRLGDLFSGTVVVEDKSVSVRRPTLPAA